MNNIAIRRDKPQQLRYASESNDSQEFLSIFLHTTRRSWFFAIPFGLILAGVAGYGVYAILKPEYKASVWLRIYANAPYIVFEGKDDSGLFIENQTQLIRSRLVLGGLMSDPKIADLPELEKADDKVAELAKRLKVKSIGRSEFFAVEFLSMTDETSRYVIEKVVDAYLKLHGNEEAKQQQEVVSLLEGERAIRERRVEDLRRSLTQLVQDATVIDDPSSRDDKDKLSGLAELRNRLVTLDVDSAILNAEIEAFRTAHEAQAFEPPSAQIEMSVDTNPVLQSNEREITRLEHKLETFKGVGENHPAVAKIRDNLDLQIQQTAELRESLTAGQIGFLRSEWERSWRDQLALMQSRLSTFEISREVIDSHLAEEIGTIKKSSGDSLQVEFLRAELEQATEIHSLISQRLLALKTEQRAPARVQRIDGDEINSVQAELLPIKEIAIASTGAFAIPLCFLFGIELLRRRVYGADQLEGCGNLHVIGEVSSLPRRHFEKKRSGRTSLKSQLHRESVDHLRTCLALQASTSGHQVFAVTSAVSREGKTSLALELAASMNVACKDRVLIIDGDLRYPNCHECLDSQLSPGLSDVLLKRVQLSESLVRINDSRLYLLPAGELLSSPHQLFGNRDFKQLLERLRKRFRYIIIDTPPVLAASEALMIAQAADAFVLCARRDHSRLEHVKAAHERLMLVGAKSMGVVLTGIPHRNFMYKYSVYPYLLREEENLVEAIV